MSKKVIVVPKGYTITVTSWENDADNYRTESTTIDTLEKAKAVCRLMDLLKSNHTIPYEDRVCNAYPLTEKQKERIKEFMDSEPALEAGNNQLDTFFNWHYELLGNSEDFDTRVVESYYVTYSPEDLYAELVEI